MADEYHEDEIAFDDKHYMTLAGIIGVWSQIFREINEPTDANALPSQELQDLSCAMSVLVDSLSEALERHGMGDECRQSKALRQEPAPTVNSVEADVAKIPTKIRSGK